MDNDFSKLIVSLQSHYNTPGWTSKGRYCPSCGTHINSTPDHYGYFVGEDSAVIYGLCSQRQDSADVAALEDIADRLAGPNRGIYYSLVYGDLDSNVDWGPVSYHQQGASTLWRVS